MGGFLRRNIVEIFVVSVLACAASPVIAQPKCESIRYAAPSGAANDITFIFDHAYPCGQFASGDWFVTPDAPGGAVNFTAVAPAEAAGRNGWDINPDVRRGLYQSFDSRVGDFRPPRSLPYAAPTNSSIIKVVSRASCESTCVQFAAVLTVLASVPDDPELIFRPPAFGAVKPLLSVPKSLLARLPAISIACCRQRLDPAAALARSKGFRNNYSPSSVWAYSIIPADSVAGGRTWGGDIWLSDSEVMGLLMLDLPESVKRPLLVAYLQQGIDIWGANKFAGGAWYRGSGGNGAGALATYAFAAAVLGDKSMLADLRAINPREFLETSDFYRGRKGVALYGGTTPYDNEESYWNGVKNGDASTRTLRDPHGYIDGGPVPGDGYLANLANQVSYTSIMLRAFPAFKDAWPKQNDNAAVMIDFGKRYHDSKTHTLPDPCAPPSGVFGVDYGPNGQHSEGFLDCIQGAGRFPKLNGSDQTNRSSPFMASFYEYVARSLSMSQQPGSPSRPPP